MMVDEWLRKAVSEFKEREDQDSVQISSQGSKRFWIRMSPIYPVHGTLTFTDFMLNPDDSERAVVALVYLDQTRALFSAGITVRVTNILPTQGDEFDKAELTRRHDQIIDAFIAFSLVKELGIGDKYLDKKGDRFDSVILF